MSLSLRHASRLAAQSARQHSRIAVRPMTTVVSSSGDVVPAPGTTTVVQPTVVEKVRVVKSERAEPATFTPPPVKKTGGLRARFGAFLAGFTIAAIGGYGFLRGDVLQVTQDIEQQLLPVIATHNQRIAALEKKIADMEGAKKK